MTFFGHQQGRFSVLPAGLMTGILALSCIGMLTAGGVMLSGCGGGTTAPKEEAKDTSIQMEVAEINQLTKLGDKAADGQYLITRVLMKNNSNETIILNPTDFMLENITDKEEERYSQPSEKFMTVPFGQTYGEATRDKLMDLNPSNLYPRLQLERYFVFMVPADAKAEQYQITYTPKSISAPLVSDATVVNDHRNDPTAQP